MRKLILGTLVALMAVSCNQKKMERLTFQKDSIQQEKDLVEKERDYFLEIISEVQANFRAIKEVELGILDQTQDSEGLTNDAKAQIQQDLQLITERIQKSKEQIAQLEEDLEKSKGQTSYYRGLVRNLQNELETRTKEVTALKAQLEEKDIKIQELDVKVTSLTQAKDSLSSLSELQIAAIKAQDEELNAGWYMMGTKKELKTKGLKAADLKNKRINKGAFTKVDIRELTEMDLGSKKAKLYTSHPEASYSLERKSADDKTLVLKIKDYNSFWSNSKILVIEIK